MREQDSLPIPKNGSESRIPARIVSRGTAVGKAVCLYGRKRQYFRKDLDKDQAVSECERFEFAVRAVTQQLSGLSSASDAEFPGSLADIFEVHLLILAESSLVANISTSITEMQINAEWAIKLVSDDYLNRYRTIQDEHLREKSVDLEDVTERLLNALNGDESITRLPENAIIVASEIRPSTLMEFFHDKPLALVAEHGGWTSHTFIMAREMGIPALAGVPKVLRRVKTGDFIGIDAIDGNLIIRPADDTLSALRSQRETELSDDLISADKMGIARTLDGRVVRIAANVDKPELCKNAVAMGVSGIGLLRTEYLFDHLQFLPDEATQYAAYKEVAAIAGQNGIRIRTFDLGVDQIINSTGEREKNPALGLKAIRLSLSDKDKFRIQLRAIIRASHNANVQIVLPLVSFVDEIKLTKDLIEDERRSLKNKGIECGEPKIGVMIETPAAVISIHEILRYVDFVCLGTNDLVQYLLTVDRDNESVADLYQTLHPAVIKSVKMVLDAASDADVPVIACGEMAGSSFYTPLLLGLGATELSMNLHSIAAVHKLISAIKYSETLELVKEIKTAESAIEIEALLINFYRERWVDLFPADVFLENKVKHNKNFSKN